MWQAAMLPRNALNPNIMAEDVIREKVYCHDGGGTDAATVAALMNGRQDPMATAAMMSGGFGGQWNNPFIYLVWMMFAQRMWGNGNGEQNQLDGLRNQMSDNHNTDLLMDAVHGNGAAIGQLAANLNCDFNQLQSAVCSVRSAIDQVAGQVGFSAERVINAANLGDCNIIQQLKDCCCTTQQNIIRMGYENQLGQKDIINTMQSGFDRTNTGVERGFSAIGYQMATDKCDIVRAGQDNTQRIIDTLNNHWSSDLQLRLNRAELELSQQRQNATLIAALSARTTTTTTTPTA